MTAIRLFGSAAFTASTEAFMKGGLSPPVRSRVGVLISLKRSGSNLYCASALISRGIVCAAATRAD
ncbi:MAG: hypothetical protein SCH70_10490 [Candidatus Methanoperedens sp.]|nr:hypothetical protein [Candidatus Methanoperedens sp.]